MNFQTFNHRIRNFLTPFYQCTLESILSDFDEETLANMCENQRKRIMNHYHWSPAITIEKDILGFLMRINHFDNLVSAV